MNEKEIKEMYKRVDVYNEPRAILDEMKDSYTAGETVGKCEVYIGDQKVGEVVLYCDRDVEKGGFLDNLKDNMKNLFKKGV